MTALAGLIGAGVAAYKILKPSPDPEPAEDEHDEPVVRHEYEEHIRDLRESLANCRATVYALRGRLDRATQTSLERGPTPGKDWLSGE